MWRWKLPLTIFSMIGFLLGLYLSAAFAFGMNSAGNDENSQRFLRLYWNSSEPIGAGKYNDDHIDPGPGKGWGGNPSTMQGTMNYEDRIRKEVDRRSGNLSNLSEEERAKLYDWLGREMHLLQDMPHSSQDSLSLSPLPEQAPRGQENGGIKKSIRAKEE
jgi:hypothetical protein